MTAKARYYDWESELPTGLKVMVGANITGYDFMGDMQGNPPESREVEIVIERYWPNGDKLDITDSVESLYPDYMEEQRLQAIMMEDDKLAAQMEDAHPYGDPDDH